MIYIKFISKVGILIKIFQWLTLSGKLHQDPEYWAFGYMCMLIDNLLLPSNGDIALCLGQKTAQTKT